MGKTAIKKVRRDSIKQPTKEAMYLRKLRLDSKISLRKAARKLGKSEAWLLHLEIGRVDPKPKSLALVGKNYGLTLEDLHLKASSFSDDLLINYRDECTFIVSRLSEEKLKGALFNVEINGVRSL